MYAEDLKIIGAIVAITILVIVGTIVGAMYGVARPSCYARWEDSGMEVQWTFWGDCRIRADGKTWIPESKWRDVELNDRRE